MEYGSKEFIETLIKCNTKKEAAKILGISVNNKKSRDFKIRVELLKLGFPENFFETGVIRKRKENEYYSNPKLCKECGKVIPFEYRNKREFCSSACSAKYNNRCRKMSEESRKKTSETLKNRNRKIFTFDGAEYNLTISEAINLYNSKELSIDAIKIGFPEAVKICKNCGKEYVVKLTKNNSAIRGKKSLFCSVECLSDFQRKGTLLYVGEASCRKKKIKQEYLKYKGGKCVVCGYDRCEFALDFHHINPQDKEHNITYYINRLKSIDCPEVRKELDKCVVLCSTHHRELHAGVIDISDYI